MTTTLSIILYVIFGVSAGALAWLWVSLWLPMATTGVIGLVLWGAAIVLYVVLAVATEGVTTASGGITLLSSLGSPTGSTTALPCWIPATVSFALATISGALCPTSIILVPMASVIDTVLTLLSPVLISFSPILLSSFVPIFSLPFSLLFSTFWPTATGALVASPTLVLPSITFSPLYLVCIPLVTLSLGSPSLTTPIYSIIFTLLASLAIFALAVGATLLIIIMGGGGSISFSPTISPTLLPTISIAMVLILLSGGLGGATSQSSYGTTSYV